MWWLRGMVDRFGLTWQPALAAGILANLNRIQMWVEVIAEEQFRASSRAARALDMLAHQVAPARARRRAGPRINGRSRDAPSRQPRATG